MRLLKQTKRENFNASNIFPMILLASLLLYFGLYLYENLKPVHMVKPPMIMVEGELYTSPKSNSFPVEELDQYTYLGVVQSSVKHWESPQEDFQVNFEKGVGAELYRKSDSTILVKYANQDEFCWEYEKLDK